MEEYDPGENILRAVAAAAAAAVSGKGNPEKLRVAVGNESTPQCLPHSHALSHPSPLSLQLSELICCCFLLQLFTPQLSCSTLNLVHILSFYFFLNLWVPPFLPSVYMCSGAFSLLLLQSLSLVR